MRSVKKYLAACVAVLAVGACGGAQTQSSGALKLNLRTSALQFESDIVCVAVLVQSPGIPPIAGEMTNSDPGQPDGVWQVRFENVATGISTVSAGAFTSRSNCDYNHLDEAKYRVVGEQVDIKGGTTNVMTLWLQQVQAPTPFQNSAPYITKLLTSAAGIVPGGSIVLDVQAADLDGDPLTYSWSTSPDSAYPAPGAKTSWTAPGVAGPYYLTVTVDDGKGGKASATTLIDVDPKYATGAADLSVNMNNWPQVKKITSSTVQAQTFQPFQLAVEAVDADNDPLTFTWAGAGSCVGFSAVGQSITLLPSAEGECTLAVTARDNRGGTGTGSITLNVTTSTVFAAGPRFMIRWLSPFTMMNPDGVKHAEVTVIPADNDISTKAFVWDDGFPGIAARIAPYDLSFPNGWESDIWYAPPACDSALIHASGDTIIPITVTVTDKATGAANTVTTKMTVTCS